jgi:hypothetical protein
MNKAQYVIELAEMMSEVKMTPAQAAAAAAATGGAGYLGLKGAKAGWKYISKKGKEAIEGSTGGGHMDKIKKHYDTAKEIAGK